MNEDFSFWKNLILVSVFFAITPLVIATSLFSLISLSDFASEEKRVESLTLHKEENSGVKVFASLPSNFPTVESSLVINDARPEIIRNYLNFYGSPLEPKAELIVEAADKYGLDFRLTTAIAQQESNLCKIIPAETHNCWGWGIHSEGTLGFSSFEEGIEEVSKGLKEEYVDKGYLTPEEIMVKYTPLSSGSWALGVNKFMLEME